jgi:hypothetical protein
LSLTLPSTRSGVAVLTLSGVLLTLGCQAPPTGKRPAPRGSETGRPAAAHTAIVLAAEAKHDFGRVLQGATLHQAFVTRNATPAAINVENTREVLGCLGVPVPRVLAPGAAGKLEVTCRATVYGPLRVALPLRASGQAAGELALTAEVEPLVAFDRALLEVNVPFGTSGFAEARLRGVRAAAAHLDLVPLAPLPQGLAATVLPATDGGSHGVTLRVSHAAAGTHAGSLRFATGLAEPKAIELGYLVKVASTLAISPTNPVLDFGTPAGAGTIVRVTSQTTDFRVERVEVAEGPFDARLRRHDDAYAIEVSIDTAKLRGGMRGVNGRLLILSNDRAEPRKEVPLFALRSPGALGDAGVTQ